MNHGFFFLVQFILCGSLLGLETIFQIKITIWNFGVVWKFELRISSQVWIWNIKLRLGCQKVIDYTSISTLNLKLIGLHLDLKITKIEHGVKVGELYLECEALCWKLSWLELML